MSALSTLHKLQSRTLLTELLQAGAAFWTIKFNPSQPFLYFTKHPYLLKETQFSHLVWRLSCHLLQWPFFHLFVGLVVPLVSLVVVSFLAVLFSLVRHPRHLRVIQLEDHLHQILGQKTKWRNTKYIRKLEQIISKNLNVDDSINGWKLQCLICKIWLSFCTEISDHLNSHIYRGKFVLGSCLIWVRQQVQIKCEALSKNFNMATLWQNWISNPNLPDPMNLVSFGTMRYSLLPSTSWRTESALCFFLNKA